MDLPTLLGGPILRRSEPGRVCVWLATSGPAEAAAAVYRLADDGTPAEELGSAVAESIRLGERLYVHLAQVKPSGGGFPAMELLGYDVEVDDGTGPRDLEGLGVIGGDRSIAYESLSLPTFYLGGGGGDITLLHGSCHKLHGTGDDALALGDDVIASAPRDLGVRPSALFLTGDQIYADTVAGPLIEHLTELGDELMGFEESATVPGVPPLRRLGVYGRSELCRARACFSSRDCANHLMSFGEFAAMYLLTFNEKLWPELPGVSEALGRGVRNVKAKAKYAIELKEVRRVTPTLHEVRRLLANVPTYMMFDDHDVTDDWNLTQQWRTNVHESLTGRRIISNALAAAWAFQMWGNDPDEFDASFKALVSDHFADDRGSGAGYDDAMWRFDRWSFFAPTSPPAVVLDTRTQRRYDGYAEPARLIGDEEMKRVVALARRAGHEPGRALMMVSPVPVYELPLWEGPQKYVAYALGPYQLDLEAWRSNLAGFVDFMQGTLDLLAPSNIVFLSGDLHYGFSLNATFADAYKELPVLQLTSSGTKNSIVFNRYVVRPLALMLHKGDTRVGWRDQPKFNRSPVRRRWLLLREEKIEGGKLEGPTWLTPKRAAALRPDRPPDFIETRTYARVSHLLASPVMGKNNLGLVTMRSGGVMHDLLVQSDGSRERFSALLRTHPQGEGG